MTSKEDDPASVYELQHEIWPGWASGEFGASDDVLIILSLIERSEPGRVLDLGCGSGRLSCAMAKLGWRVHGIDSSADLIDRARRRAHRRGVAATATFEVGDLRQPTPEQSYELVILWDSVLAIWPWSEARQTLAEICEVQLAHGGDLVIGQLNPAYFTARPDLRIEFENPAIGPGRTRRRYTYTPQISVLCDDVTVYDGGAVKQLPTQCLYLVEPRDMEEALEHNGIVASFSTGSKDWNWTTQRRQPDHDSAQFIVIGHKP